MSKRPHPHTVYILMGNIHVDKIYNMPDSDERHGGNPVGNQARGCVWVCVWGWWCCNFKFGGEIVFCQIPEMVREEAM